MIDSIAARCHRFLALLFASFCVLRALFLPLLNAHLVGELELKVLLLLLGDRGRRGGGGLAVGAGHLGVGHLVNGFAPCLLFRALLLLLLLKSLCFRECDAGDESCFSLSLKPRRQNSRETKRRKEKKTSGKRFELCFFFFFFSLSFTFSRLSKEEKNNSSLNSLSLSLSNSLNSLSLSLSLSLSPPTVFSRLISFFYKRFCSKKKGQIDWEGNTSRYE